MYWQRRELFQRFGRNIICGTARVCFRNPAWKASLDTDQRQIMTSLMRRNARPIRHDAPPRLFGVGQAVRLKGDFRTPAKIADVYHVTAMLPPRENSPQYRIRSDAEPHERVVTEDRLEPAGVLASDAGVGLIEKTFGHGLRTETLQPRGQETEAGKPSA